MPEGDADVREPLRLLLRDLGTGPRGLSSREAARRLAANGPNVLEAERRQPWWVAVVAQLVHPLALLLWVAAALSLAIGTPVLAIAIAAVVLLNAVFALWQEHQTEAAVELLRAYLPQSATVVRDGVAQSVPAAELVPGDVVVLGEGDRVCADGRLLDGAVEVDLSTVTGESVPVVREAGAEDVGVDLFAASDLVFSGTTVMSGQARAVVSATGMRTELGRIAALSRRSARQRSPLELQVRSVAWLIAAVAVVAGLAFIPLGTWAAGLSLQAAVIFAVGLLVANVPEGLLPTIMLALAVGVRDLAARGALVKRLSAVETLGSTDVICTDKTGTLTLNAMAPSLVWTLAGELSIEDVDIATPVSEPFLVLGRSLAGSDVPHEGRSADPTDIALAEAARRLGATSHWTLVSAQRFDAQRRVLSALRRAPDGVLVVDVRGAPESVLERCVTVRGSTGDARVLDVDARRRVDAVLDSLASRGLRVLGVASRSVQSEDESRDELERGLELLGLVALVDPVRPGVADAVARCHDAGIRVLMVTGDHALTAAAVAREVGIGDGSTARVASRSSGQKLVTVTAGELRRMEESELDALLNSESEVVFARSAPEAKLRITDALRDVGSVVAMTGDGVNDAPALRRADIGVAMGRSGTDVARDAATMVLTDDDFSTIVSAVQEGRRVYSNVRKFILYIFAHATPEVIPFVLFALSGGTIPLPLTVLQILAIDIGTETLPALALGREPAEPGIMARPPRPRSERIITRAMLLRAWLVLGGVSAVLVTAGYAWVLIDSGWSFVERGAVSPELAAQASTMTFLGIVACQVGTAVASRTERESLWKVGLFRNRLLLWGIAFEIVVAAGLVLTPGLNDVMGMALPPGRQLAVLPLFPIVVWGVDEVVRWLRRRRHAVVDVRALFATRHDSPGAQAVKSSTALPE